MKSPGELQKPRSIDLGTEDMVLGIGNTEGIFPGCLPKSFSHTFSQGVRKDPLKAEPQEV